MSGQSEQTQPKIEPINKAIGGRIRERRVQLGMSQETLGQHLGLSFQQVQRLETGAQRANAMRLFDLSQVLDAPIAYFFDAVPTSSPTDALLAKFGAAGRQQVQTLTKEEAEVLTNYRKATESGRSLISSLAAQTAKL